MLNAAGFELLAALVLLGAIYYSIVLARPLINALVREYNPRPLPTLLFATVESSVVFCAVYLHLPLLGFYILIYCCKCAGLRLAGRAFTPQLWFCVNLLCAHLAMAHLFSLGVLALALNTSVYNVYNDSSLCLFGINLALIVVFAVSMALKNFADLTHIKALADAAARQREVGWFAWFALVYIVCDSFPGMLNLPYTQVAGFLVGSSIFLWLQLYLFLGYAYRVFVRQHFEHEYRQLEQQQLEHLRRAMELRKIASVDELTGVFSRTYVMKVMNQWLLEQKAFSVAYVDLNGLKYVNDRFGHESGDEYLVAAAHTLNRFLRSGDVLGRIGGDEFLALMPGTEGEEAARLMETAERDFELSARDYPRSFGYGIEVALPGGMQDAEAVIHQADIRMYADKKRRKLK